MRGQEEQAGHAAEDGDDDQRRHEPAGQAATAARRFRTTSDVELKASAEDDAGAPASGMAIGSGRRGGGATAGLAGRGGGATRAVAATGLARGTGGGAARPLAGGGGGLAAGLAGGGAGFGGAAGGRGGAAFGWGGRRPGRGRGTELEFRTAAGADQAGGALDGVGVEHLGADRVGAGKGRWHGGGRRALGKGRDRPLVLVVYRVRPRRAAFCRPPRIEASRRPALPFTAAVGRRQNLLHKTLSGLRRYTLHRSPRDANALRRGPGVHARRSLGGAGPAGQGRRDRQPRRTGPQGPRQAAHHQDRQAAAQHRHRHAARETKIHFVLDGADDSAAAGLHARPAADAGGGRCQGREGPRRPPRRS